MFSTVQQSCVLVPCAYRLHAYDRTRPAFWYKSRVFRRTTNVLRRRASRWPQRAPSMAGESVVGKNHIRSDIRTRTRTSSYCLVPPARVTPEGRGRRGISTDLSIFMRDVKRSLAMSPISC